jgi:hypothetical protein
MPGQPLTVRPLPFPHLAADGLWDDGLLSQVAGEFPDPDVPGWKRYENTTERKLEGPPGLWKPATRELFAQIKARTPDLEEAFGIPGLHMETVGGGYHLIPPGGYLAVHADFNRSPHTGRYRRLNHLIYLNDGWDDEGGALELWDETGPAAVVAPEMNRTVVFETSDRSWHGHPQPAARWRKSVAAYFFTGDPPARYSGEHSTLWHEAARA